MILKRLTDDAHIYDRFDVIKSPAKTTKYKNIISMILTSQTNEDKRNTEKNMPEQ